MSIFQNKRQQLALTLRTEAGKRLLRRATLASTQLLKKIDYGQYASLFRSGGIEFAESKPYNYGDDARYIDWKVSSRLFSLHSKYYHDDTNKSVWFIFDCSGSMQIGSPVSLYEIGAEATLIFMQLALYQKNKVGSVFFSKDIIDYIKLSSHEKIIEYVLSLVLQSQYKTEESNLEKAIYFSHNILPQRSLVVICSDFLMDNSYFFISKLSKVHDVVLIKTRVNYQNVSHNRGLLRVFDAENRSQKTISFSKIRREAIDAYQEELLAWEAFCNKHNIPYILLLPQDIVFEKLLEFFANIKRR